MPICWCMLQKMVKQREESLAIFTQAGRTDLATVEQEEIAILSEFLPKGLSEAEVEAPSATPSPRPARPGAKDMGKVIAALKADYPGRIDFGKASAKVKAALGWAARRSALLEIRATTRANAEVMATTPGSNA
jgi:uncharacterized protein YqeY